VTRLGRRHRAQHARHRRPHRHRAGRNVIGIELPNAKRETVLLGEMFGSEDWTRNTGRLPWRSARTSAARR
jgi:DNA segregation ATPase FtsK/SpoIIIE-like protein